MFPVRSFRREPKTTDEENASPSPSVEAKKPINTDGTLITLKSIEQPAPNIALNVHGGSKTRDLIFGVLVGILIQFGFLVFVGATVYHPIWKGEFKKDEEAIKNYAFPIMATGTLLLMVGVCRTVPTLFPKAILTH
jgi:hypothetical protein